MSSLLEWTSRNQMKPTENCRLEVRNELLDVSALTFRLGKSLHDVTGTDNPYQQVVKISARTLNVYDSDNLIPCYGFGDCRTGSQGVFSFFERNQPARGLEVLLKRYKEIVPYVDMNGPTSFAPLIRQALKDVYDSGMKFHILLIIADGQVSRQCQEETQQAIIDACDFPLSIVVIGVGDGPWEEMERFDAGLPGRPWDNFRFCQFDRAVNAAGTAASDRESCFESNVLQELSDHYEQARTRTGAENRQKVSRFVREKLGAAPLEPPPRC